ncbi:membrane transporter [Oryctes borbonicus]|uniref:Membrane transporter n=1 Tax=Oryctes borbonicus TaxID=1629725 RepID=A0A0T6AZG7_9SCAR|nr:membrane transporter [Oryctes borbonicus]
MHVEQTKMVPPDGGWGWVAVIGVSIVNLCTRSIEPSFGLLFGDLLSDLGVATTGAALIMSTLDALINFSGLFVGPLIRAFSYRKVSLMGSLLCGLGLMATFPARSMTHILATYSIINGLGVGLTASATFVALNHYFVKRRGQAVGFSLAGTAFGMMLMPQAVRLLLEEYSFRGAILILGAMALNSLVGSALLQPAKWHYIPEEKKEEEGAYHQEMETIRETDDEESELQEGHTLINGNLVIKTLEDLEKQHMNIPNLSRKSTFPRNFSTMSFVSRKRKESSCETGSLVSSYSRLDFTGSSLHLQLQTENDRRISSVSDGLHMRRNMSYPGVQLNSHHKILKELPTPEPLSIPQKKKDSRWKRIVAFMDFDLLKDPIYLNLVFGLSVFYVAEQNFKMVTPFFLSRIGYNKSDIALFLSVQALTDILARLVLPPICDRIAISKRTFFMVGIFVLGICRSVLAEQTDWTAIMIWLCICGFVRGAAFINFTICISEYSTLEKLPAAFGLHMVGKGLFVVAIGPILGVIRDMTDSYPICLHSQTCLIMSCFVAWSIEYIIRWCKTKDAESESDTTTT